MAKIDKVAEEVHELKNRLLVKEPSNFSMKDFVRAFFGALLLGLTFSLKGQLINVTSSITKLHMVGIIIVTFILLTAEIYFVGYRRVREKLKRKFGQFWIKRIVAFYFAAMVVSVSLVYLYGLNLIDTVITTEMGIVKLIIIISLPCAIGAATGDLLKKY